MVAQIEIHELPYYFELLGYLGIFLFFLTIDQITPIPEEVSLLTIGYLSSNGMFNPAIAGIISLAAFITVDTAYFFLIKLGKKWEKRFMKKTDHSFLKTIKDKFTNNYPGTLFMICFIPRLRLWAPIISSVLQIPYARFIKYDAAILSIFTALYIALGVFFHKGLQTFVAELEALHNYIFIGAMILATIFILLAVRKYRHGHKP